MTLRHPSRQQRLALAAIIIAAMIVGFVWYLSQHHPTFRGKHILPDVGNVVGQLPRRSAKHPPIKLTGNDPVPTNSWLSSLVFASKHSVTYAYPWTYQPAAHGATVSYAKVTAKPDVITAPHTSDLTLDFSSDDYRVGSFDDLSAVVNYQISGRTVGSTRLVQGSPYLYLTLKPHQSLTIRTAGQISSGNRVTIQVGSRHYGIWHDGATDMAVRGDSLKLTAGDKTSHITLITLPHSVDTQMAFDLAGNAVTKTSVSYDVQNGHSTTTYHLDTANRQPTLMALLPYQTAHNQTQEAAGTITTILGEQTIYRGNDFRYTLTRAVPSPTIITHELSSDETAKLKQQLQKDIAATTFDATDSYGAGKQLYRAANLLELAHEIHDSKQAGIIAQKLTVELATWFDPHGGDTRSSKYFYYDPDIHGLVGVTPSFGSEQFNDHQFHYGYFVYAAATVARYDRSFADKHRLMVAALIRDIASPDSTADFPLLRTYDSYVGHDWADGYGDTPDGNNQESSSEAVNSAYAIYLWAQAINNNKLKNFATWLYQNETTTALASWVNIDPSAALYHDFDAPLVSLVWQGKLEYHTFFSNEPSAKLGIQLIPMSPGQAYLATDKARIESNLRAATHGQALRDYLLMYEAMADPAKARNTLASLDPSRIDSADSLSYLMAWVYGRS